jgi:plastocyanin
MTGMMISMVLGMSVGITVGVILGILYSGNLFYSTIFGMIVGLTAGFLAGIPVSLMAVMDGMLSGLMGGMMGAMLGEMIAPEYRDPLIKMMFLIFVATIMILSRMMQQEFMKNQSSWTNNPVITLLLFGVIFFGYQQLGPTISATQPGNQGQDHSQHNMDTKKLVIQSDEFAFSPNQLTVKLGEKVTLVLDNVDNIEHDLEIIGLEAKNVESENEHNHNLAENKIHIHAQPRTKQMISFIPMQSGTYRYICTLPGHKESGMMGSIHVS